MEIIDAAQQVCPTCGRDEGYRIPRSLGRRWPCGSGRHDEHADDQTDMREAA
jgi:hypothetical protein